MSKQEQAKEILNISSWHKMSDGYVFGVFDEENYRLLSVSFDKKRMLVIITLNDLTSFKKRILFKIKVNKRLLQRLVKQANLLYNQQVRR